LSMNEVIKSVAHVIAIWTAAWLLAGALTMPQLLRWLSR
jgi:hypothetical protein